MTLNKANLANKYRLKINNKNIAKKVWNLFKVISKGTFIVNFEQISFIILAQYFYCWFWTLKSLMGSFLDHCLKRVCIRNFSGPHFAACGLNTEIYSVIPNTDRFYAVDIKCLITCWHQKHGKCSNFGAQVTWKHKNWFI